MFGDMLERRSFMEWLVWEWVETVVTCVLGLHDCKLGIDFTAKEVDVEEVDGDQKQVENPASN